LAALDQRNFPRADWFDRRVWSRLLGPQAARGEMLTLVARQDGDIVGAVVGRFQPSKAEVSIWSLAVDEPLRGSGLARHLLAALLQQTPTRYRRMTLEARRGNVRARRFYVRLGFLAMREVHAGYADGEDAISYQIGVDELRRALSLEPHPVPRSNPT
jgi:ribosomal protein S18 acetylase RimI-like enzyme